MGLVVVDLWVFGCWRWWWGVCGVGEVADYFLFYFIFVIVGVCVVVRWWVAELLFLMWWLLER